MLGSTSTVTKDDENSRREEDDIVISQESIHSSNDENNDHSDTITSNDNTDMDNTVTATSISFLEEEERIERIVSMNEVKKSFIKGMRDVVATRSVPFDDSSTYERDDDISSRFVDTMDGSL